MCIAFHAPEVKCIGKGKSRQPHEFGVKAGIASTLKPKGAKAFVGNPWDGHTLNTQLEQAAILMQDNQTEPSDVFMDLGYRGMDGDNPMVAIKRLGSFGFGTGNGQQRQHRFTGLFAPSLPALQGTQRHPHEHVKLASGKAGCFPFEADLAIAQRRTC